MQAFHAAAACCLVGWLVARSTLRQKKMHISYNFGEITDYNLDETDLEKKFEPQHKIISGSLFQA